MAVSRGHITTLVEGKLYALSHAYEVDGRVSWHARKARGFAPMNCYLFLEEDRALLVDTGMTVHEDGILDQLQRVLEPSTELSIFLLRQGEFDSISNVIPISEAFNVKAIYGVFEGGYLWADFRPEHSGPNGEHRGGLEHIAARRIRRENLIELGDEGRRNLQAFFPPLRLLNTCWVYDQKTRTLLTSDAFSHVLGSDPSEPWIVTAEDDDTTVDIMRDHLLETRYWWLAGARTDRIRSELAQVFDRYQVDTIAPAFGYILRGREVVDRHYLMLDSILADVGEVSISTSERAADRLS